MTNFDFQNIVAAARRGDESRFIHAGKLRMNLRFSVMNVIDYQHLIRIGAARKAVMSRSHLLVVLFKHGVAVVLDEHAERSVAYGVAHGVIGTAVVVGGVGKIVLAVVFDDERSFGNAPLPFPTAPTLL